MWSYALIWLKNYLFNLEENKKSFSSKADWKLISLIVFSLLISGFCYYLSNQNQKLIEEKQNISKIVLTFKNENEDLKKTITKIQEDKKITETLILKDCKEKKQNQDLKQKSLDKISKIKLATYKKTPEKETINKKETQALLEIKTPAIAESYSSQMYRVLLEDFCFDNNNDVCENI